MTKIKLGLVIMATCCTIGCATPLEQARTAGIAERKHDVNAASEAPDYCRRLDREHTIWGAIAKGAVIGAGSSGVAAIPLDTSRDAQIAVGATAAALAIAGGVALYVQEQKAAAWARECATR
jgi:hypothetical protein